MHCPTIDAPTISMGDPNLEFLRFHTAEGAPKMPVGPHSQDLLARNALERGQDHVAGLAA